MRPAFLLLLASLILLAGCPPKAVPPAGSSLPEVASDLLGADDVIEIRVFQEEELSDEFAVGTDGTIQYPLLGRLELGGKSTAETAQLITDRLADGYLLDPQVTVRIVEQNSLRVAVLGEVARPGRYPYRPGMTLVEAIADAGGTTEKAALNTVPVTRTEDDEEKRFDVPFAAVIRGRASDFRLRPGDVVVVPTSPVK